MGTTSHRGHLLFPALGLAFLVGCSSSPEPEQDQSQSLSLPDWYDAMSSDDEYYYGYGEGHSARLDTARRQARLSARGELAEQLETQLQSMAQEGAEQSMDDPEVRGMYQEASRQLVEQDLVASETDESEFIREDDGSIRVFLRMRMPQDQSEQAARNALDEMDAQLDASRQE